MRETIGAYLVRAGVLAERDLDAALAEQARTGDRLGAVLVRLNLATEERIARALAEQLGFQALDLVEHPPDPRASTLIPEAIARAHVCVGVDLDGHSLTVAMADPLQLTLVQELESRTGCRIRPAVAAGAEILAALESAYGTVAPVRRAAAPSGPDAGDPRTPAASAAERLDAVIRSAAAHGATDVHLEPLPDRVLVRHRIDGALITAGELPIASFDELVAHVKRASRMDEGETRLPQEGRLRSVAAGVDRSFHVSTTRTLHGEKIRLRGAGVRTLPPALDALGLSSAAVERLRESLRRRAGLVLAVGPAGSGRTTTICAAIASIDARSRSVVAIAQEFQYDMPGVSQIPIVTTRADALAAALRQDPDVVLVDTLDDVDTAGRAIMAGREGRLVVSTMTVDDPAAALQRLADLRIEPSTVASALTAVVTQRLVRRLCLQCRRRVTLSIETRRRLGLSEADASEAAGANAAGCAACAHTGYRGRIGLFEVMPIDEAVRPHLAAQRFDRVRDLCAAAGVTTLEEDGLAKVMNGTTTADELLRVAGPVVGARPLCPACGFPVSGDHVACPRCGDRLGGSCMQCGRALLPAWRFCPYCS